MEEIVTCKTCGLVQRMESPPEGSRVLCSRCGFELHRRKPDSRIRTLTLALGALILYIPANLFPIVQTEYWGMQQQTTIFQGIHGLFKTGSYFIGCLVLTTSIISPVFKILGLIVLSITLPWHGWEKFRAWIFRIIQVIGPWNMLEVMLLAIVVSVAEMGRVATVYPGTGVFSFAGVVVLTLLASATFDPRLIWDAQKKEAK